MSRTARSFIALVTIAGILLAAVTLAQAEWRSGQNAQFILYMVLAALTSGMKVRLPGVHGTLSVNFIFILLSAVELPNAGTLLICCTATLAQCLLAAKVRPTVSKLAFNLGNAVLGGVVCSSVYDSSVIRMINDSLPVLLFAASLSYFLVNTSIVAAIIALTEAKPVLKVWRENFLWTGPQYICGAAVVGAMHVCNSRFGWEYAALAFPAIYLLDRSYRVYLSRLQEEKDHAKDNEEAYARLAEAQQGLMALSREAGMAEVASGVLHNVGNVLNSVNVSATLVDQMIRESRVTNLVELARTLQEHSNDLPGFLTSDPKGQRVVPYLAKLAVRLEEERQFMLQELKSLTAHIGHIKEIVAMQQSYGKVSGLVEAVSLAGLVEDAISIAEPGLKRRGIHLARDHEAMAPLAVDRHRVLQILLNLLRNAGDAIEEAGKPEKVISTRICRYGEDRVRIEVQDNGIGIRPDALTRIFAHGFTTKQDGHGFGLHSGALAAKQLGGALWAKSEGLGMGATFTLELPLSAPSVSADESARFGDASKADIEGRAHTAIQPSTIRDRFRIPSRTDPIAHSSAARTGT